MFEPIIARFKHNVATTVQSVVLTIAIALFAIIALGFLAAALFVYGARTFGLIETCLAFGGFFVVLALIAVTVLLIMRRHDQSRARVAAAAKPATPPWWQDPKLMAVGLELTRGMRARGLLPLGVAGAFVMGLLMSRQSSQDPPPDA